MNHRTDTHEQRYTRAAGTSPSSVAANSPLETRFPFAVPRQFAAWEYYVKGRLKETRDTSKWVQTGVSAMIQAIESAG